MTAKYLAILTNQGAARLANAAGLGTKLNLTQMAVGDANGALPTPDPAQTKLINQTRIAPLNLLTIDPANPSQIIAEQIIPENEGGFWIREIGLYDDDGILIAVANCPETYKPQLQEGSGRTQTIRMVLIVSSTSAITLKIDPSVVLATRQYVDDKVIEVKSYVDSKLSTHEQSRNHPDATTAAKGFVQLSSDDNSAAEDKAATPAAVKKVRVLAETKAPIESPVFTGSPTTPTPAVAARGLEIANAEFVAAKVAALVGSAPGVLDTLQEIAAALNNNPDFANEMIRQLAGKQPIDEGLTALSGLATGEEKLPYFTGKGSASLADFTRVGRDIAGAGTVEDIIHYLSLGDAAKKNVGTTAGTVVAGDDLRLAKAFVRFSAKAGTIQIQKSLNVTSIRRDGAGLYKLFFSTPMPSADYVAVGTCGGTAPDGGFDNFVLVSKTAADYCDFNCYDRIDGQSQDSNLISMLFF
ncbi:phage tail protein [Edwardsiella anguillarum]|uniref:phage tail protein n=1 Tax=Edwardsiella anguillarum TaxID=1821960 RepID=UPI0024B78218|nr:phage tail protein [Edwardsiella anguillarum]WHQ17710.1 phage tail protein [Edwardsiella anguillarum]WHQ21247.1 phage tail protein [Edwardsiella anguillarum]WHQ24771.1 phage tail protein [Edwardsiella anguillarum]